MTKREDKAGVLQGTLDLIILRTLEAMGPEHGFGLAKRMQQISAGVLDLNQGTLYPALLRSIARLDWLQWGVSDNNRKAKFYHLTKAGLRQISQEAESWARTVALIEGFLRPQE